MEKIDIRKNPEFAQKVINAAYDYLTEGASYRKVAPLYDVSYFTIKSWFDKYLSQIDSRLYAEVKKMAESRTEKTVDDPEVRERVAKAVALIVQRNLTVKEIASELGESEWTVYLDLVRRLPKISELSSEYYDAVKATLSNHSMINSPYLKKEEVKQEEEEVSLKK